MTVKDLLKFSIKNGDYFVDFDLYNYKGYEEVTYRMCRNQRLLNAYYYDVYLNGVYSTGGNFRV